jgi:peptide chain release factor 1
MLEKLEKIENRFCELAERMADPQITSDHAKYTQLAREYSDLEEIVQKFHQYKRVLAQIEDSKVILKSSDEDLRQLAEEELNVLYEQEEKLTTELQILLIPPDPHDTNNAILEIRAGTGGDEAGIFAGDLYRMYAKYGEQRGWEMEVMSDNPSERGGFKEIIASVIGKGAYGQLKFESGVHRVQRVPDTETQGRIHTSAASVVVLPEVEDVEEIDLDPNDLRIDVFRASGHGGQHVNTTDSAVRIVHIPSGITASCQDEKSQLKNKQKAMKVLKARLYDFEMRKRQKEITSQRRSMIRSGDRSDKIRTYNYPQGRVTDHRINLTLYRLEEIMGGNLDELITKIQLADQEERLKESEVQHVNG